MKKKKMKTKIKTAQSLEKMAKKGFKGYPIATVAAYGPDDQLATKAAVGIVVGENEGPIKMKRWYTETTDVRRDKDVGLEIVEFIKKEGAKSVIIADRIMGCPHEEGKDYPEGEVCPECPFWANKNRFTGETIQ
jgi:hypothetical protein